MNLDESLRRFRPALPPPSLRERILARSPTVGLDRKRRLVAIAATFLLVALVAANVAAERSLASSLRFESRQSRHEPLFDLAGDGVARAVHRPARLTPTSAVRLRAAWTEGDS